MVFLILRKTYINHLIISFLMKSILAFGDSITFGRGVFPSKGWANRLKEYFESKDFYNVLYNLGIPGDSSTDLLKRFETETKSRVQYYSPDNKFVILIAIGTNDSRGLGVSDNIQTNPKDYEENICKLVDIAKTHTKEVVIIGLSPVDETLMPFEDTYFSNNRIEQFNKILEKIAQDNNLLFCDIYSGFKNKKNYHKLLVDGIHPNDEGYKLMYEIIKSFLIENKLIK